MTVLQETQTLDGLTNADLIELCINQRANIYSGFLAKLDTEKVLRGL